MVQKAALYVDAGLQASPDQLDFLTSFQSSKGSVFVKSHPSVWVSRSRGTQIDLHVFLPGFITVVGIVTGFIVSALASHVAMRQGNRSGYTLRLRVAEVARFARQEDADLQGNLLFLKLHSNFTHLSIGGVAGNCGTWSADEILTAEIVM